MSNTSNATIEPLELETTSKEQSTRTNALSINVKPIKKSSYKEAFLNLYKCCIGSGILAAPYTFYKGGYILTSLCYFLVGTLMVYSQLMLMRILDEVDKPNLGFTEITRLILGEKYVVINRIFVVIMQWGVCASYILFFMEFFEYAIYHNTGANFEHEIVYLGFAMCIIVPLIFINNMALFTKFSALSNSFILITLIACFVYYIIELVDYVNYDDIPMFEWKNIPLVLGVAMYSFEAIGSLLNIRLSMEKVEKFPRLMTQVFTICTIQFWLFGLLGSLSYGDYTSEIILFSLGKGAAVFQILYSIQLLISLPLQLLPAFQLIERMNVVKNFIKYGTDYYLIRRTSIRFIQVLLIAGLAIGIPQFAILISFIGGLAGSVLQFFFPLMFYQRWEWKEVPSNIENIVFKLAMWLGCLMGSVAVIDSIYQIANG